MNFGSALEPCFEAFWTCDFSDVLRRKRDAANRILKVPSLEKDLGATRLGATGLRGSEREICL